LKKEYNPQEIEEKLLKEWEEKEVFKTEEIKDKEKFYTLEMFPYPSGYIWDT